MKIKYIADDGKLFDTRWECETYEESLEVMKYKNTVLLFDRSGNSLPLTDEGYQEATFLFCLNDNAADYAHRVFQDFDNPWGDYNSCVAQAGCWYYNGDMWMISEDIISAARLIEKYLPKVQK